MKRTVTPVKVGESKTRYTLRLTSDPCRDVTDKKRVLIDLFRTITDSPSLILCGPVLPQKIAIVHDGEAWQIVAEADDQPLTPQEQ